MKANAGIDVTKVMMKSTPAVSEIFLVESILIDSLGRLSIEPRILIMNIR